MGQKKLIWRLYPSYLLVTLAALVAVTAYCSRYFRHVYHEQVRDDLHRLASLATEEARTALPTESTDELKTLCQRFARAGAGDLRLTVIAPSGRVLADSHEEPAVMANHADRPEVIEALRTSHGSSVRFSPTLGNRMMYVAVAAGPRDAPVAVVRIASPLTEIDRALRDLRGHMIWAGLAIAVGAAALSLWISRRLSRPITQIEQIAERFATGELDLRVPMPDSAELAALARSLNKMATELGERITTITEQRNTLDAILSSMVEGVFAVDDQGLIVRMNAAAGALLGLDPAQARGRPVEDIIRHADLQQFIRQTLADVGPAEADVVLATHAGRSFNLHGARLTDARGRRSGAVIVLNDLTRIRRLETIRRDFVANVSHELKTPVTSIQGFAEALAEGSVKDPVQIERYLSIIARHASRLNAIIDDLLTLSRLEEAGEHRSLSFAHSPVRPALQEAIDLSGVKADEKRMRIDLVCDDDLEARVNPPLLEQAVINLIDNAVKYSPEGSRIHVEARADDQGVSIAVTDEGCGIAAEHLTRIFERFYVVDRSRSGKLGGTGLGLAIVKHIAQAHGGRITVQSTPGQGSTFTLHLPAQG